MRILLVALLAWIAVPASAETWREAETRHFRIFSSGEEKALVKFSERLEQFHTLLQLATGANEANRRVVKVRVYLVPGIADVVRLVDQPGSNIAGFYSPREDGAIAVVPRSTGDGTFTGQLVLFHEYAHHYMLQYTPAAYPSWYVEGFAEIASTASFERKGAITFGKAASHREWELDGASRYPVTKMLDGTYIADRARKRGWSYGDAWLLTHFLTFNDARRGQLRAYLNAINSGRSHAEAARAFGDLADLQRQVSVYLSGGSFPYRAVPVDAGAAVAVNVRTLGPAEAALIDHTIEFGRRTDVPDEDDEEADDDGADAGKGKKAKEPKVPFETRRAEAERARARWIGEIEAVANRFPDETAGWLLLADARCAAEEWAACNAAAARALAIEPGNGRGLVRKAEAELATIDDLPADQQEAAVERARKAILTAMATDIDDPVAQLAFNRSYAGRPGPDGDSALTALMSAVQLVPQQSGPRLTLAGEWMARGRLRDARTILRPLAYAPHESGASRQAQRLIAEIDAQLASSDAE
ncbi:MAG: hypothetical protein ACEQR8_01385 [Cypionkella sp.]